MSKHATGGPGRTSYVCRWCGEESDPSTSVMEMARAHELCIAALVVTGGGRSSAEELLDDAETQAVRWSVSG